MKQVELEKTQNSKDNAFKVGSIKCTYFPRPWHFHPEYEIVLVTKGKGLCFAGNGILPMVPNSIYFLDANMPHFFKSDPYYYNEDCESCCQSIYIQFKENILPANYLNMPGCKNIKHLLVAGKYGLMWNHDTVKSCLSLIEQMEKSCGFVRLQKLYTLLDVLGNNVSVAQKISSETGVIMQCSKDLIYIRVLEYISLHFQEDLSLSLLADYVGMNKTALCRYFKHKTGASIFDHVLTFRISYAKNQLANTDLLISKIAYDAGFNNLSHFNVQFKRVVGFTPTQYRKSMT